MLDDPDPGVLKEAVLAITWCPLPSSHPVPADKLRGLLANNVPIVRGLAAVALAKYHPEIAGAVICGQLQKEESQAAAYDAAWAARGRASLTQSEIDELVELYRAQMKYIQAIAMLPKQDAFPVLAQQAFRSVHDYSRVTALVAAYQLWDRLGDDPQPAIEALSSPDSDVADRAQWALVESGPAVLPAVRKALRDAPERTRSRLITVLAWQADTVAIPLLHQLEDLAPGDSEMIRWAIGKIETMETTTKGYRCCGNNQTR